MRAQENFLLKKYSKFQKSNGQIFEFKKCNGQKNQNLIQVITYRFDVLN